MTNETLCPFCTIDTKRNSIIRKNELMTSFLSNPRLMPGHALVVPNRHIETPADLTAEETLAIYEEAQRLVSVMLSTIAKGVDTWQKTRPDMPQGKIKVDHVHVHVLPSNPGDEIYATQLRWTADAFSPRSDEETKAMQAILQK
jgi:ATP adenylyltransferase